MKLKTLLICIVSAYMLASNLYAQKDIELPSFEVNQVVKDSIMNKIHIHPGAWRPLYNSEQIFWISPPWKADQYIYIDFPEAIFIHSSYPNTEFNPLDEPVMYLSHVSDLLPAFFNYKLSKVIWEESDTMIRYERELENFVSFGGEVRISDSNSTSLILWIKNNTNDTLRNILLQTCAYLYPIKEFNQGNNENKYIHTRDSGWISLDKVLKVPEITRLYSENGKYRIGWLKGSKLADFPIIIASSKNNNHHIAWTWYENTYSLTGNPGHPCFHADPYFPDIKPNETKTIKGELIFYEGTLTDFSDYLKNNYADVLDPDLHKMKIK